jgi:hypothetical protein
MDLQTLFSVVAIALTFVGYGQYIFDILKKKTKPHVFTWFVVGLVAFLVSAIQLTNGGGAGSFVLLAVTLMCVPIFILSLWYGSKEITVSDIIFFGVSLVALVLWLVVDQPFWSLVLILVAEVLAFVPTIRKSWKDPYSETMKTYGIFTFRHGLSIFALEKISMLTALYPAVWVGLNFLITLLLIVRRAQISKK